MKAITSLGGPGTRSIVGCLGLQNLVPRPLTVASGPLALLGIDGTQLLPGQHYTAGDRLTEKSVSGILRFVYVSVETLSQDRVTF